ncbi:MAG: hypothetical protein FP816_00085 [Desulfobacteraceae bacterium]|nr:hypothetical protein [Desulfobacteraceae bacterium]
MPRKAVCLWILSLIITNPLQAGYAQDTPLSSDSSMVYTLRYGMTHGKVLRYKETSKQVVELKIPEIGMDLSSESTLTKDYTLSFISRDGNKNIKMAVTINDITSVGHSNSGKTDIDFSKAKGKTFHLMMTDLGKVLQYIGVEGLNDRKIHQSGMIISIGVENSFNTVLLELPPKAIRFGETWKAEKSSTILNLDGVEQTIVYSILCTFEGLEKIDGRECLKIKTYRIGTITGAGTTTSLFKSYSEFHGQFESFGTVYIDPEEVVVIKGNNTSFIHGEISIRSFTGQYVEPFKRQTTIELLLVQ